MEEYIAHIREEDGAIQTIREHDENVASMAASYSLRPYRDAVYNSGLLHDIGKYQKSFQERIRGRNIRVDHSTAGAVEAGKLFSDRMSFSEGLILEYIIAGHHAGLPDGGSRSDLPGEGRNGSSLSARLKKEDLEDYSAYEQDGLRKKLRLPDDASIALEIAKDCGRDADKLIDKFSFLVRFCYSCLVDADSLDTERFCRNTNGRETLHSDFQLCLQDINRRFENFSCVTSLQKARSVIQKQAYENIKRPGEVYMMSMPTGSGKTLCGTKCALLKAIEEGKKRIIYIIPYNSIIMQTADTLSEIFGKDANILRHQSTYSVEDNENASEGYKLQVLQATENWDAEIIITTLVQFFETAFSNRRSRLRKMHNMADSVLIFDEVHLMPLNYMQPCLETIVYLTRYAGCSAIFLTATMPDYGTLLRTYTFPDVKVVDLIPDKKDFDKFRKCTFADAGILGAEDLVPLCRKEKSVLIVVNSRKKAKDLYDLFSSCEEWEVFHLSTFMTKADIEAVIRRISAALAKLHGKENEESQKQIIVISTSLIEAGVDLDFDTVWREYSGLDSILQAGGRCNREGRRKTGNVYVFGLSEDEGKISDIRTAVTRALLTEYADISSPECIREYFERVFIADKDEITRNSMHNQCQALTSIPFASYDGEIIKDTQQSIVVPNSDESKELVERLQYAGLSTTVARRLQKYTCSVPMNMFEELSKCGVLENYGTGIFILTNLDYYNDKTGISTEGRDYFI